jgi:outer membrane biosynthesis protein TonB
MRKSVAISAAAHVVVLTWGAISFAAKPPKVEPTEALPVDIISSLDFSQMTAGSKTGTVAQAKPQADKIGERKPVENPTAQVVPKNEVKAAKNDVPPPPPKPPTPAPKAAQAQPKRDLIAEAIKREEAQKPDTKPVEAKTPVPPKKPPQPNVPAFDPNQVMALLDKRAPQRQASMNDTLIPMVSRGAPAAQAAAISQSELDALRARLYQLWNPPAGVRNPEELVVQIRISLNPDGRLASPPMVLTSGTSPLFLASRESAARAILRGQPFDMLKPEHYEQWKEIEITFDPRQMFPG